MFYPKKNTIYGMCNLRCIPFDGFKVHESGYGHINKPKVELCFVIWSQFVLAHVNSFILIPYYQ